MNKKVVPLQKLYAELKDDSYLDKHSLDEEATKQAFLYSKWSMRLGKEQEILRKLEIDLIQYKAQKMLDGKKEKQTVSASENGYRVAESYGHLNMVKRKAERRVEFMQSAVYSMMQRKTALECLVKLRVADYYSEE